jgi:phosphate transport system substrate-binding protein
MSRTMRLLRCSGLWMLMAIAMVGCFKAVPNGNGGAASGTAATTNVAEADPAASATPITIDGSSTVFPISQAVTETFGTSHPDVEISVGSNGTSAGMKNFVLGTIDLCGASRPIKEAEQTALKEKGIEYLELQVAIDGLSVVVNPANDWSPCITVAELNKIWAKDSTVTNWSDVNPAWPAEPIKLFGADTDSGTFDYFTEVINGKAKESRTDYTPSSNDNVLVNGVADSKFSLGYFGYGYYAANQDRVKAVSIKQDDAAECVAPSPETILNGSYSPLSRPLFIYVNLASLKRPEVAEFVQFYLSEPGQAMVTERKYIPLPPDVLADMQGRLQAALQ